MISSDFRYPPAKEAMKGMHAFIKGLTVMETVEHTKSLWKGMVQLLLNLI